MIRPGYISICEIFGHPKWYEFRLNTCTSCISQSRRRFGGRGESDSENSEAIEDDYIEDDVPENVDEEDDGEDLLADGFEEYVVYMHAYY